MSEPMLGASETTLVTAIKRGVLLSAIPSIAMIVMSAFVNLVKVPDLIQAALQHLAAGIVFSAVAVELVPILSDAPNSQVWYIAAGFSIGILTFLVLGACLPEEESKGTDGIADAADDTRRTSGLLQRPHSFYRQQQNSVGGQTPSVTSNSDIIDIDKSIASKLADESDEPLLAPVSVPPLPATFAAAVMVDALVDGFLIGITSASSDSSHAGVVMTVALTVEMGFLAMTFSSALTPQSLEKRILGALMPPISLILGGLIGASVAAQAEPGTALNTGIVSFGVAALLYLVTEELLLEAHETTEEHGGHVWWIDLCFFLGFLLSFLLEKLSGD